MLKLAMSSAGWPYAVAAVLVLPALCMKLVEATSVPRSHTFFSMVCVLVSVSIVACPTANGQAEPDGLQEMQSAIDAHGLAAFDATGVAHQWPAPVIPSAWYIENTCPPEHRPAVTAARRLGSALLAAIDAAVPALQREQGDQLLTDVRRVKQLADWIGTAEGYENLILDHRARDIAATGIARLVANLDFPLSQLTPWIPHCPGPSDVPATRARVLNQEAGAPLFPTDQSTLRTALEEVWRKGAFKAALVDLPPALLTPGPDQQASPYEQFAQTMFGKSVSELRQPGPYDRFFKDDKRPHPATTRALWNGKYHELVEGLGCPPNVQAVEALLHFRERVGQFPERNPLDPFAKNEAAFRDALNPHGISQEDSLLAGAAWAAYDAVKKGAFVDEDSRATAVAATQLAQRRRGDPTAATAPPATGSGSHIQ